MLQMEGYEPNVASEAAQAEGKLGLNAKAPQIGAALPSQAPKVIAKPAKVFPPASAMITSSSQRDTQTRLLSSGVLRGSQEKDEYLLRLLGKGSKPPLASAAPSPSTGFRVPDPVPHRAAQASNRPFPSSAAELGTGTAGLEKGSNPAGGQTATASGQPTSEVAPGWSYSETQRRIGSDAAGSLRATVIAHQVVFLEQLYDLHRAIAVQKLLVRNCPEVKHLMDEAARILVSSSSGQKDQVAVAAGQVAAATIAAAAGNVPASAPPAKRARLEKDGPAIAATKETALAPLAAALPATAAPAVVAPADEPMVDDDGEPGLRPDSQFAAVPLPGETAATGDGSGDDGDGSGPNGSGGNGSGGGSNSPQPQLPPVQLLPPRRLLPLQGAPSEASQAPMMFPRANFMAPPWIQQPLMPFHMQMQMQMPPGMDPMGAGGIPPHYHQQYANIAHMQTAAAAAAHMGGGVGLAAGGSGSGALPLPSNIAQQMAVAAAAGVAPVAAPTAGTTNVGPPAAAPVAPLSAAPAPPVLISNPAVPASGASGQPSSRPPLPPQAQQQQLPMAGAGIAASPAAQVAAAGGDPMAWWAQHYYGRQQQQQQQQQAMQMQMAAQMGPPQNAQQAQQMANAAAVAAFGNPATAATNYRWWQDPTATFGPPVDLNVVAAGVAAATRKAGTAAGEAESAPPSTAAAAAATATAVNATAGTNKQKGSQLVAPPSSRPRRSKRKPSDPIEEASSGTTGQDHHLGPHAVTDDAHFKSRSPHGSRGGAPPCGVHGAKAGAADTSAAKLLLSFCNKGHVA
jgi:hypothetical protein